MLRSKRDPGAVFGDPEAETSPSIIGILEKSRCVCVCVGGVILHLGSGCGVPEITGCLTYILRRYPCLQEKLGQPSFPE